MISDASRVRYHAVMARTGIVVAALLAFTAVGAAFEPSLDQQSLAEAIALGLSRIDDMRSRFHATYRLEVMQPPVDYIEVVTPFRRVALDAEAHTRAGERLCGQREALAALGDTPSRVDLVVELTFHPLNNYVGMPDFDVALVPTGGAALRAAQSQSHTALWSAGFRHTAALCIRCRSVGAAGKPAAAWRQRGGDLRWGDARSARHVWDCDP